MRRFIIYLFLFVSTLSLSGCFLEYSYIHKQAPGVYWTAGSFYPGLIVGPVVMRLIPDKRIYGEWRSNDITLKVYDNNVIRVSAPDTDILTGKYVWFHTSGMMVEWDNKEHSKSGYKFTFTMIGEQEYMFLTEYLPSGQSIGYIFYRTKTSQEIKHGNV